MQSNKPILADGRWSGPHGIGRFSQEVLSRLQHIDVFTHGPKPSSVWNILWQINYLRTQQRTHKIFFSPGFNPVIFSKMPFVFTIHDLIHLHFPDKFSFAKHLYYEKILKPAIVNANKILTVSEHSKKTIVEWSGVSPSQIINVSCGISEEFFTKGEKYQPGFPYLLSVSNAKPHKNIPRLVTAFSQSKIDASIRLLLTCQMTEEIKTLIEKKNLNDRIIFLGSVDNITLAKYYRGALALIFPSLYEGLGLPPLEAMASGIPVLTSNVTAMPETVGDAALLVNPYKTDAIQSGIEKIIYDTALRAELIKKGFERTKLFSWDKTAMVIQKILHVS